MLLKSLGDLNEICKANVVLNFAAGSQREATKKDMVETNHYGKFCPIPKLKTLSLQTFGFEKNSLKRSRN